MNYTQIPSAEIINKTAEALSGRNFQTIIVDTKQAALDTIKELIPKGSSIMNGASVTLNEIGYIDYLKSGQHGWKNLHEEILAEKDEKKQAFLRKHSVVSDAYVGSAHSITSNGEIVIASNTGSQLPHLAYTSNTIVLVVGAQKITADLPAAMERLESHVIPLEDERMKKAYGYGTMKSKVLTLHHENPAMGRKFTVIIVKEKLGF